MGFFAVLVGFSRFRLLAVFSRRHAEGFVKQLVKMLFVRIAYLRHNLLYRAGGADKKFGRRFDFLFLNKFDERSVSMLFTKPAKIRGR